MVGHDAVRESKAGLLWPTLATAVAMLVLLALGTWQLERKAWKDALIARIAEGTRATPIPLDTAAVRAARGELPEYTRVRVRGRLHADRTLYYLAPDQRGTGWHAYTPVETPAAAIVMVNRGYVSDAERKARTAETASGPTERDVDIVGLVRHPAAKGAFTPANQPDRNMWLWRDLTGMARAAFPNGDRRIVPFFVDAEAAADQPAAGTPRGGTTRLMLPNRHLEYALTWYGLALALAGVYLAFALPRMRASRRGSLRRAETNGSDPTGGAA